MTNEKLAELINGLRNHTHVVEVYTDGPRHVVCWAKGELLAGTPQFLQEGVNAEQAAELLRAGARQRVG